MGLSICQSVARTLEHPLNVRSRVGGSSVFAITVPFGRALFPTPVPGIVGVPMPDLLAGLRVLCVDNDREILYGMRALLTRWHAVPLTASTVYEALALQSQSPDVALVDCLGAIDALRARSNVDAGRVADRRRQRCVETCRAATRLSGADQADQTGVAACLSGGAAEATPVVGSALN